MTEKVLNPWSDAYQRMEIVAKELQMESPNCARYVVEDVYLDRGADWMWTTILRKDYNECQILSPREWQRIVEARDLWDLAKVVRDIRNDIYFGDR